MPSWFEAAAFALDVYRDKDRPPLPKDCSIVMDCPVQYQKEGYFGAAYVKPIRSAGITFYDVSIVHRGTDNIEDFLEDLLMYFTKEAPAQFESGAIPFIEEVIPILKEKYGDYFSISFVGHSLGANLAELSCANYASTMPNIDGLTISFESPGSLKMIQNLMASGKLPSNALTTVQNLLVTFLTDVDIVNSCMEHVDQAVLTPNYVGYSYLEDPLGDGYPIKPGKEYFALDFSARDQHKMKKIYDYWKQNPDAMILSGAQKKASAKNFSWPNGIDAAFDYYMNYSPYYEAQHQMYWDQYIQLIWKNYPDLHNQFPSEAAYAQFYIKHYLHHNLSSVPAPHDITY